jgi:uncharacterized membrane protein YhhN
MVNILFWLALFVAVLDWLATARSWQTVRWASKPGTLLLLIAWFSSVNGWSGVLVWFGIGLIFSLLGDVLLMLPGRFFMGGLIAFFAAHVFYITGFVQQPLEPRWEAAVPILLVMGAFITLNGRIHTGLRIKGEEALTIPVIAYSVIISLMWLAAISTFFRTGWQVLPSLLVSIGAGLFFVSDSVLALDRFVRSYHYSHLLVMVIYHMAQFLLMVGVLFWASSG